MLSNALLRHRLAHGEDAGVCVENSLMAMKATFVSFLLLAVFFISDTAF